MRAQVVLPFLEDLDRPGRDPRARGELLSGPVPSASASESSSLTVVEEMFSGTVVL